MSTTLLTRLLGPEPQRLKWGVPLGPAPAPPSLTSHPYPPGDHRSQMPISRPGLYTESPTQGPAGRGLRSTSNSTWPKRTRSSWDRMCLLHPGKSTTILPEGQSRNWGVIIRNSLYPTWRSQLITRCCQFKSLNISRLPSLSPPAQPPPQSKLQLSPTWATPYVRPDPPLPSKPWCCWPTCSAAGPPQVTCMPSVAACDSPFLFLTHCLSVPLEPAFFPLDFSAPESSPINVLPSTLLDPPSDFSAWSSSRLVSAHWRWRGES